MTDTSNRPAFEDGSTVIVKPGAKNIFDDPSYYPGKTVEVVDYDEDDDTYLVRQDTYASDWFAAADLITVEAYRAEQRAKVLAFFAGDEATLNTNYAGLDNNRLMIDGVYDIDALIKLLQEI